MTNGALRVLCPKCQWFVLSILKCFGNELEIESNCPREKCSTTVHVVVKEGKIAIEATPKAKKA